MLFCWIKISKITFLSVPLKMYIQIQIFRLRGFEAVILTRIDVDLVGQFVQ